MHTQFGVEEIDRAETSFNLPLALAPASPHDWPGEFGSTGHGDCPRARLPHEDLSAGQSTWRVPLVGPEVGGACLWGSLVMTPVLDPTTRSLALHAYTLDNGQLAWQVTLGKDLDLKPELPRRAATPACDGQSVFVSAVIDGRLRMFAVDLQGRLRWERDAGPMACEDGRLISPLLFESLVIVSAESRGDRLHRWQSTSHLTALHRLTGEIIYRVRRPPGDGFATPVLATFRHGTQLIIPSKGRLTAYDPRRGEPIWWSRWDAIQVANSIAWDDTTIYAGSGDPLPQLTAIRADGTGDVTNTHLAWQSSAAGSTTIAPVRHRDHIYALTEDGWLTALDAGTGKVLWRKSLAGSFVRSPIPAGDDLMCLNMQGAAYVLELAQRGAAVFELRLSPGIIAAPAATDRHLILRDRDGLVCRSWGDAETTPIVTAPARPVKRL